MDVAGFTSILITGDPISCLISLKYLELNRFSPSCTSSFSFSSSSVPFSTSSLSSSLSFSSSSLLSFASSLSFPCWEVEGEERESLVVVEGSEGEGEEGRGLFCNKGEFESKIESN